MIFDIILKDSSYFLKIHTHFFENRSFPTRMWVDSQVVEEVGMGDFHLDGDSFGLDGCFSKTKQEGDYHLYEVPINQGNGDLRLKKMLQTVHLCTYYCVEGMYYAKEYFDQPVWNDQSLTFNIFRGGQLRNGYSIGGQIYPWLKKKLSQLEAAAVADLRNYIESETQRVYRLQYNRGLPYSQFTIGVSSFFFHVDSDGRWLSWNKNRPMDKPEDFSSHNIDHFVEQYACFIALIALNTWLREH
ncbi:MAG: hypothetical protein NUV82_03060 [Candidatus Komeilibacteria bacterium]|nr:hypothetical protein [Candidatus Komeilibacteria bacterium]